MVMMVIRWLQPWLVRMRCEQQAGSNNNNRVIDQSIARIAIAPSLLLHQPPRSFIT